MFIPSIDPAPGRCMIAPPVKFDRKVDSAHIGSILSRNS